MKSETDSVNVNKNLCLFVYDVTSSSFIQLGDGIRRQIFYRCSGVTENHSKIPFFYSPGLIEVGAQTNTKEEVHNAMEPLAEILAAVLLGTE